MIKEVRTRVVMSSESILDTHDGTISFASYLPVRVYDSYSFRNLLPPPSQILNTSQTLTAPPTTAHAHLHSRCHFYKTLPHQGESFLFFYAAVFCLVPSWLGKIKIKKNILVRALEKRGKRVRHRKRQMIIKFPVRNINLVVLVRTKLQRILARILATIRHRHLADNLSPSDQISQNR